MAKFKNLTEAECESLKRAWVTGHPNYAKAYSKRTESEQALRDFLDQPHESMPVPWVDEFIRLRDILTEATDALTSVTSYLNEMFENYVRVRTDE